MSYLQALYKDCGRSLILLKTKLRGELMRQIYILTATLFTLAATAAQADCPNLTGTWQCKSNRGNTYEITMLSDKNNLSLEVENKKSYPFILDGSKHTSESGDSYKGACHENEINFRSWIKIFHTETNEEVVYFTKTSIKVAADLQTYTSETQPTYTNSQGEIVVLDSITEDCKKLK